ncbi:MAG: macro domain-containing protein [Eubacteriales bacterium]|nr:macro domain-containing protein [Eubacteriales bacterium]
MENRIEIKKISITDVKADAIVNAANRFLAAGGGVCGAIFSAAGMDQLSEECARIGGCPTGEAVITSSCKLKTADYIIHAVGPDYRSGRSDCDEKLFSCYQKALQLAVENGCMSVSFPVISSGIFGCPAEKAWRIAISSVSDFFAKKPEHPIEVIFVGLQDSFLHLGRELLKEIRGEEQ